jgi:hypothetical protein
MTEIDDLIRARVAEKVADAKRRDRAKRRRRSELERRRQYGLVARRRDRERNIERREESVMAEHTEHELIERFEVEPPSEPDERGWIACRAMRAVWKSTTMVADVDDVPHGVTRETHVVDSVSWLPPDSPRWARLEAERRQGEVDDA